MRAQSLAIVGNRSKQCCSGTTIHMKTTVTPTVHFHVHLTSTCAIDQSIQLTTCTPRCTQVTLQLKQNAVDN
jgi:hypothetical protein